MRIIMDKQQYQELEDLIEIFKGMSFDKEEVQCFSFIKDIVDREYDTNDILKEKKRKDVYTINRDFWMARKFKRKDRI